MKVPKLVVAIAFLMVLPIKAQDISTHLKSDKSLNQLYSALEIESFSSMVKYTDSVVLAYGKTDNVEIAYHIFLDSLRVRNENGKEHDQAIDEIKKYEFLDSLDSTVVNDIWSYESSFSGGMRLKDTVVYNLINFKSISLVPDSRFTQYLQKPGPMSLYYKELGQTINAIANLSAGDYFRFIDNHRNFDFTISKNRLWASIFILSMEETYFKKFERWQTINQHN